MPKVFSEVVEKATVSFLLWKVPWLAAAPLWKLRAREQSSLRQSGPSHAGVTEGSDPTSDQPKSHEEFQLFECRILFRLWKITPHLSLSFPFYRMKTWQISWDKEFPSNRRVNLRGFRHVDLPGPLVPCNPICHVQN